MYTKKKLIINWLPSIIFKSKEQHLDCGKSDLFMVVELIQNHTENLINTKSRA